MPINRTTLNTLYGLSLNSEEEAAAFLARRAEPVETIRTSADVVISAVGRDLYEKFFQGYTRKQWGMDPSELDKSVTARSEEHTSELQSLMRISSAVVCLQKKITISSHHALRL